MLLRYHHEGLLLIALVMWRLRRPVVSHVLQLLLLLHHHNSLGVLPELKLFLLIDELEELVAGHREDLVKPTEHEAFKVLIGDAKNRRSVAFDFALPVEDVV